jgi:hypothetical protein
MEVKNIEADTSRRNLSYSMVNTIGGKNPRALRRPNKGKKYNSNTSKNRSNRIKKLALLSKYPSK